MRSPVARCRTFATALIGAALLLTASNAQAAGWVDLALVSGTLGNTVNKLCVGAGKADLGCPSVAPTLNPTTGGLTVTGDVTVTGIVSATAYYGDGSHLSNIQAGNIQGLNVDRITSGTQVMTINSVSGLVNMSNGVTNWGYLAPTGYSYLPNLATTILSATTISGSTGTFGGNLTAGGLISAPQGQFTALAATNVSASNVDLTGTLRGATLISTSAGGTVSATNGYFANLSGNGSGLTGVTASSMDWYGLTRIPAQVQAVSNGTVLTMQGVSSSNVSVTTNLTVGGLLSGPAAQISSIGVGNLIATTTSATNVSVTTLQLGAAAGCTSGLAGVVRYSGGTVQVCNGSTWETLITNAQTGDRITSGTTNVIANQGSGGISFTVAGVTTGYFYNGMFVANAISTTGAGNFNSTSVTTNLGVGGNATVGGGVTAARVDTTNISASNLDLSGVLNGAMLVSSSAGGTVSATNGYFANVSGSGAGLYNIPASAINGLNLDRITSGTQRVVVNSATGVVSLSTAGADWGYLHPSSFSYLPYLNTLGVSATGPISGTLGYFSGNVGIGVAPSNYGLYVNASARANQFITGAGSLATPAYSFYYSSGVGLYGPSGGAMGFVTSATERLRIVSTGLVGIGTQSPTAQLDVSGTVKMAYSAESCDASHLGAMMYSGGQFQICRNASTGWENIGAAVSGTSVGVTVFSSLTDVSVTTGTPGNMFANGAALPAGTANTVTQSTAFGVGALSASGNTGYGNTGLGNQALYVNTSGYQNTGVGGTALRNTTGGYQNTAVGYAAMFTNTSGLANTAMGRNAGGLGTTASQNTMIGFGAGYYNVSGNNNAMFGSQAGYGNSGNVVSNTTAIGMQAGYNLTSSTDNVLLGYRSGFNLASGGYNVLLGDMAGSGLTTGSNNIMIGYNVQPQTNADSNTLNIGNTLYGNLTTRSIGISTTTPASSFTIPAGEIQTATSGQACAAANAGAIRYASNALSYCNGSAWTSLLSSGTTLGVTAFASLTDVSVSSASAANMFNTNSLAGTTSGAVNDTAFGYGALSTAGNTGFNNTAFGTFALGTNTGGYNNVGVGRYALYGNTTGYANVAMGRDAMYGVSTGHGNTGIGDQALGSIGTGNNNTTLGLLSGNSLNNANNNTLLGAQAGLNLTTGSNNLLIGYNVQTTNVTDTSVLNIGNLIYGSMLAHNIGISTTTPQATLDVSGTLRMAYSAEACDSTHLGAMRFTGGQFSICRNAGTGWETLTAGTASATTVTALASLTTDVSASGGANMFANGAALPAGTANAVTQSTAFGFGALAASGNTGSNNTAFGTKALNANTSGYFNSAFGSSAMLFNTTGVLNSAFGGQALRANTTGSYNTAVGLNSMQANSTGGNNTALGFSSLVNNTGGGDNTAMGLQSGYNVTNGASNTLAGVSSGFNLTTGSANTLLGWQAGAGITTGSNNIVIGNNVNPFDGAAANNNLNIGGLIFGNLVTGTMKVAGSLAVTSNTTVSGTVQLSGSAADVCSVAADTGKLHKNPTTGALELCVLR